MESGDTFSKLATRYNTQVSELRRLNPEVDPRRMQIGQEITVREAGVSQATQQSSRRRAHALGQQSQSRVTSFTPLNQSDPAWGSQKLGRGRRTLSTSGCMLASLGMVAQSSGLGGATRGKGLDDLNKLVRDAGGFSGSLLNSHAAARAMGMKLDRRSTVSTRSADSSLARIDEALGQGRAVVVGVDYKAGSRGSSRGTGVDHWITITQQKDGQYQALDPAGGLRISLERGDDGMLRGRSGNKRYTVRELIELSPR